MTAQGQEGKEGAGLPPPGRKFLFLAVWKQRLTTEVVVVQTDSGKGWLSTLLKLCRPIDKARNLNVSILHPADLCNPETGGFGILLYLPLKHLGFSSVPCQEDY